MSVIRVGSTSDYASNWDSIFGGSPRKKKTSRKKTVRKKSAKKKASKKASKKAMSLRGGKKKSRAGKKKTKRR